MPLVPELRVCEQCGCGIPLDVSEVKLVCETCHREELLSVRQHKGLTTSWTHCHDEFMSLRRVVRCTSCGCKREEYFPYGRVPLDCLPGTYDSRVFVGGNYEQISSLRDIKTAVYKVGSPFVPILPYDDFQIPPERIYEWDLRLLHNCKYAIFEVTHPAGELMEIARCAEYGVTTLLVYQSRGAAATPPRARTMLLQSGSHDHRAYRDTSHLAEIVGEFLLQKSPKQWKRAVEEIMGYHYEEHYAQNKLYLNGEAEHTSFYRGLKADIPNLQKSEQTHDFRITSGIIIENTFKLHSPSDNVSWRRDSATSSPRAEVGIALFAPSLKRGSAPVDYTLQVRTKGAYILSKKQVMLIPPEEADDPFLAAGLEFASKEITFPTELFKLQVEFPDGYLVTPKPAVYFGREPRSDGLKIPPDRFVFERNSALLEVRKPLIGYRYAITWSIPEDLPPG